MTTTPRRYDHAFTKQDLLKGTPVLVCAHSGCSVVWWPDRRKPITHCPGAMLLMVAADLLAQIQARVAEIGDATGCEASAARAYERGRFDVVSEQMWTALGLPTLTATQLSAFE
jgi:hypothetical protein